MPKMDIVLDRVDGRYYAGEQVSGKVLLTLDKQVKYRKVKAALAGVELTEVGAGKNRSTAKNLVLEDTIILKEEAGNKRGILNAGSFEFPFTFTIPNSVPPTYGGAHARIFYGITASVDIPAWFDIKAVKDILVSRKGPVDPGASLSFSSDTLNSQKPSFTVSAGKSSFTAGESVKGTITALNPAGSDIRQAVLKLCAVEHAKAGWSKADLEVFRAETRIPDVPNGVPKEFSIQIPADAAPTFTSKLSGISWQLEATLDLPLRFDVKAKKEITVL